MMARRPKAAPIGAAERRRSAARCRGNAMLVAADPPVRRLSSPPRRYSARRATPSTSSASRPRCWCSASRMSLVVLVGGIDLSVGSVVLASATLAGIVLAEGLHPVIAIAMRQSASAPRSGALNAALVEGLRISPVIVTLGTHDRRPRPQPRGARRIQFLGRDQGADLRRACRATLSSASRSTRSSRWSLAVHRLVRAARSPSRARAARGRRCAGGGAACRSAASARYAGRSPMSPAAHSPGLAGVLVAARTGLISPSIGQGLEFFAIAVVALGAGGLPAGRVTVGADGDRHADPDDDLQLHDHPRRARHVADDGDGPPAARRDGGRAPRPARRRGRRLRRRGFTRRIRADDPTGALLGAQRDGVARRSLLALVFVFINPRFATMANVVALIEQNATLAIVAVGAMIGIVSRSRRHLARLGHRARRRRRRARRAGRRRRAACARRRHPRLPRRLRAQRADRRPARPRPADRDARRLDLGARPRGVADRRAPPSPSTWASSG